jgi:CheY-like chemotaxis protein
VALQRANGSPVVLVVEDEFLVRDWIVCHLRDCGFVVLEAGTAQEAITLGGDGPVDVLLTDINLSGQGTGWDVAEALRDAQPDVGVVYVSGNSVDKSRRVTGSLFFSKPYRQQDILQACRDVAACT